MDNSNTPPMPILVEQDTLGALGQQISALQAENNQLRVDAERYRGMLSSRLVAEQARLLALQAENDKLRADAERYRWLRGRCVVHLLNDEVELRAYVRGKTVAGIDAAIDAARAAITGDSNG